MVLVVIVSKFFLPRLLSEKEAQRGCPNANVGFRCQGTELLSPDT